MWLCGINDVPTNCSRCGAGMYAHYAIVDNPFGGEAICEACEKREAQEIKIKTQAAKGACQEAPAPALRHRRHEIYPGRNDRVG